MTHIQVSMLSELWQTFADATNSLHSTCKSKWSKVGNATTVVMVQFIAIFVKLRTRHLRLNVSQIPKHFEMGGSFQKQSDYFTASWTTRSQIKAPHGLWGDPRFMSLPIASCNAMQCSAKLSPKQKKRKSCPLVAINTSHALLECQISRLSPPLGAPDKEWWVWQFSLRHEHLKVTSFLDDRKKHLYLSVYMLWILCSKGCWCGKSLSPFLLLHTPMTDR